MSSNVNNDKQPRIIEVQSVQVEPKKTPETSGGAGKLNYSGSIASNISSQSVQAFEIQQQILQQQSQQLQIQNQLQQQAIKDPNNSGSPAAARRRLGNLTGPGHI